MAWAEAIKTVDNFYIVENAMDALLLKSDEALDGIWLDVESE